jgi:hypothetical protein
MAAYDHEFTARLSEHEAEIFWLLANGWVAVHTVKHEFRINNGPAEDMAIIDRLIRAGLVMKSSERAYVARVYPLPTS